MFEYKMIIITKRGNIRKNENFSVHKFEVSSQAEIDAIVSHPTFAGWKNGISVGYSREVF